MARARNFTFTINNYKDTNLVDQVDCRYIIYGKEVAPTTNTPHLQGTIVFKHAKSLSSVIKKLPGAHVEVCISLFDSIAYCKKEGAFVERGDPPLTPLKKGEVEQDRWRQMRLAAEAGEFEGIDEHIRFRFPRVLQFHRDNASKRVKLPDTEATHLWYWGPSGTGKSRKAREDHPDAYLKSCSKWWCGYDGHDTVIIEDFDTNHSCLCHHLKIWGDRYPFPGEYKGGSRNIRPKLIIVTSNYHPKDIWHAQPDLEPILRRFCPVEFPRTPFASPDAPTFNPYNNV